MSIVSTQTKTITGGVSNSLLLATQRQRSYFGTGADGDVTYSVSTNLTSTLDGAPVVMNYASLTINAGVTVTTSNRCRGLVIYVLGNCTINGTLTMTARGASASGQARVFGRRSTLTTSSNTDLTAETISDPYAIGGLFTATIPSVGGAGGVYTSNGSTGVNGQTGGGGAGNQGGSGSDGTSFSGGAGGGGKSYSAATGPTNGGANGGAGGAGASSGQRGAGGGGSGGGSVLIMYRTAGTWSAGYAITATGGSGGAAGTTAGGSGGGGGGAGNPGGAGGGSGGGGSSGTGGLLVLIVGGTLTLGASSVISANGSSGGSGGNSSNNDVTAGAGASGGNGTVATYQLV